MPSAPALTNEQIELLRSLTPHGESIRAGGVLSADVLLEVWAADILLSTLDSLSDAHQEEGGGNQTPDPGCSVEVREAAQSLIARIAAEDAVSRHATGEPLVAIELEVIEHEMQALATALKGENDDCSTDPEADSGLAAVWRVEYEKDGPRSEIVCCYSNGIEKGIHPENVVLRLNELERLAANPTPSTDHREPEGDMRKALLDVHATLVLLMEKHRGLGDSVASNDFYNLGLKTQSALAANPSKSEGAA